MLSLGTVVDDFIAELDQIESIFAVYRGHRNVLCATYSYVPGEDGCLISLWDAWTRFLRSLCVISASGVTEGLAGAVYVPTVARTEARVLADLMANARGNNFGITNGEPKWGEPTKLANITAYLGLANSATIQSAVSASSVVLGPVVVPSPLDEIRKCRNYVAHKSPPTLRDVKAFARGTFTDLSSHLRRPRSGVETFCEWRDCLAALAVAAAQ